MTGRLTLTRVLLAAGLLVGLVSWWESVGHIGSPAFMLPATFPLGPTHGWYHVFREVCKDVAEMVVFLAVFFGPPSLRTRGTWWLILVLMLGYYAPFWIGEPFLPALSAPNMIAHVIHSVMAALALAALFVGRSAFVLKAEKLS